MHKQEIPAAELRLNPRHLGPITIRVDVTQDQATVAFTAQHAAVKEAIEAALPKLREMFSAQQLSLAEVNVSQEDTGQRQARSFAQMGSNSDRSGQKEKDEVASNEQAEKAKEIADEIEAGRAIASNGILSIFA
jgi:flagellar hook-length control protein FliK